MRKASLGGIMAPSTDDMGLPPHLLDTVIGGLRGVRRIEVFPRIPVRVRVEVTDDVWGSEHRRALLADAIHRLARSVHPDASVELVRYDDAS